MKFQVRGRVIFFATNNVNKFDETRRVLAGYGIAVGMLRVKSLEIQSDSLAEIAQTSVVDAFQACGLPVIVEDAGLFIDSLNGFPGPYTAYVYKTIGNDGVLRVMSNFKARKATFKSVVAYFSKETNVPICFEGEVRGEITTIKRKQANRSSFGFDPIFKPLSSRKTFAEMNTDEKNQCSHRANALHRFAEWYKNLNSKNRFPMRG